MFDDQREGLLGNATEDGNNAENGPPAPASNAACSTNGEAADAGLHHWHARAGREGARRVHELIREGRLYEQERGLKRGRQRLRQLIELGKRYEAEHGLRPAAPKKAGRRLSRMDRDELMTTLLQCLVRIAKPSFRAELTHLIEALPAETNGDAA